ncbi:MAG: S-layer homology domain-containing protein, partial [Candidatus Aenigmatarchaeota archaeon]
MRKDIKFYVLQVIFLGCISTIISTITITLGYTDTFLKLYCVPNAQDTYGYSIYAGSPLMSLDGKIILNMDPFGSRAFAVLDHNGNLLNKKIVNFNSKRSISELNLYPLADGEISFGFEIDETDRAIIYGVLDSTLRPKFIRAIKRSQIPFETNAPTFLIFKKAHDGYYAFLEYDDIVLQHLLKLDLNGNIQKIINFQISNNYAFENFKELSDGTIGFVGSDDYSAEFAFVRADLSGEIYTAKSYFSKNPDYRFYWANSIAEDTEGNLILLGVSYLQINNNLPYGLVLLKIDKAGDIKWAKLYYSSSKEFSYLTANEIFITPDGYIYVIGTFSKSFLEPYKIFILKLNNSGEVITSSIYSIDAEIQSAHYFNNYLYIAGRKRNGDKKNPCVYLLKVDNDGRISNCQISQITNFGSIDLTHLITTSSFEVNTVEIPASIPLSIVDINLRDIDIAVKEICVSSDQPSLSFVDVSSNYWAYAEIVWVKERGISKGYPDGTFRPEAPVLREQMAAFIIRALLGENFNYSMTPYFHDVPTHSWSFRYVQKLYEMGITKGCGGAFFCPYDVVTRAQMAAFLVRALVGEDFSYSDTPYFSDVPREHWAFKYIQK